jgi:hypothetical protein
MPALRFPYTQAVRNGDTSVKALEDAYALA